MEVYSMKSKVGVGRRRFRLVLTAVACSSGLIQGIDFQDIFMALL